MEKPSFSRFQKVCWISPPPDGLDHYLDSVDVDIIRVYLEDEDFRYGDVIQLESFGQYRNDGKYIWDGFDFQILSNDIDEYGHIPSSFQVIGNGYPADYWEAAVCHNSIAWLNIDKFQGELLKNYHSSNHGKGFITHFTTDSVKYYLTNGLIKPSDGECCEYPDDDEFEVGHFCCEMTEEFFLTTLRKGGIVPIEASDVSPKILHLLKKFGLDNYGSIIYHHHSDEI